MLDAKELKVVLATLSARRTWLNKALEDSKLEETQRQELIQTAKLIDSAMQKLAVSVQKSPPPAAPSTAPAPAKKPPPKRKDPIALADAYVLVAEDNPDSMMLLRGILDDLGIKKIDSAKDGREALHALQNSSPPYDLVLCDWDMPEMSGLEVRKQVKQLAKLQDTHFMMVTAVSEAARIREAIGQGITDYIVKPIDIDILERKIRIALGLDTNDEAAKP
jgi:two-component system, chemotaxis family, chemotaxis protein CheY